MKILEDMILERGIAVNEDILMNLPSILRDRVSQRLQPSKVPALLRH